MTQISMPKQDTLVIVNMPTPTTPNNTRVIIDLESSSQNTLSMIVFTPSSHANVVIETGIAPTKDLSVQLTPSSYVDEVMETGIALTNDLDVTRLEPLIQEMSAISVIKEGSTSQRNIPLIINAIKTSLPPIE